ncbi:MAG: enterotoxin, partial [Candidatus Sulfotelmatobacter sp.]
MPTFKKVASIRGVLLAGLLLTGWLARQSSAQSSEQSSLLYGASPGIAKAEIRSQLLSLSNQMMEAQWSVRGDKLTGVKFVIRGTRAEIALPRDPALLIFKDGTSARTSEMTIADRPRIEVLQADPAASRAAEHFAGRAILVRLQDPAKKLSVDWRAILRDGSNYIRQEITISALSDDQPIAEVRLFDGSLPGARVIGSVKGSPVTAGDLFLGFEDPLAQCQDGATVICAMKRELPLRKGQSVDYSLVIGAAPPGQMRRGFLNYVERERAHPYRTFLHYNTWYDIGFGKPYDAAAVRDVISAFGTELVRKRGVKLDSFLLDDGWDNPHSTWQMGSGFPGGIAPLNHVAHEYGAAMGVWLSPWGGYEEAKQERLDFGRKNGFETNEGGFALSGPKYYARFREVSLDFIRDGVNQFKIDGTGNVDSVFPGSSFDSDFAAAISLIRDWRAKKPDLYVNLTTGTYPSPFWLRYADSIWR